MDVIGPVGGFLSSATRRRQLGHLGRRGLALNDEAVKDGDRLLSAYLTLKGKKLWVITEADRSSTTLLLPEEY